MPCYLIHLYLIITPTHPIITPTTAMNSGAKINRFFRSLLSTAAAATTGAGALGGPGPGGGGGGGGYGLELGGYLPEVAPPGAPPNQIDADFAYAMRLQQEEQRQGDSPRVERIISTL